MKEFDIKAEPIKFLLVVWACGLVTYLVVAHAGTGEGFIDPMIPFTAIMTLITTKVVDWLFRPKMKKFNGR